MKNLKYLVFLILSMFVVTANVDADLTEVKVKDASELASCVTTTGNYCILEENITVSSYIMVDNVNVYVDLNNHNISGENLPAIFRVKSGSLTITGKGIISNKGKNADSTGFVLYVQGNTVVGADAIKSEIVVDKDVKAISDGNSALFIKGKGAKATINGYLESKNSETATLTGNGIKTTSVDNGNTVIVINDGAVVKSETSHAIYHPQSGKLTINGGTITGVTGIEMRSGELIINGGKITATADETVVTPNANGGAVEGAAVALAQHTTIQSLKLEVNGGTLKGASALYETTPQNPNDKTIVSLEVKGGEFVATSTNGSAIYSENKTGFVAGGIFSNELDKELLATNLNSSKLEDGTYVVGEKNKVTINEVTNGKVIVDKTEAIAGETIKVTATANEGYKIKSITANGEEVKDNKFIMPNKDVEVKVEFEKVADAPANVTTNPKTGDNVMLYSIIGLMAIIGLGYTLKQKREN